MVTKSMLLNKTAATYLLSTSYMALRLKPFYLSLIFAYQPIKSKICLFSLKIHKKITFLLNFFSEGDRARTSLKADRNMGLTNRLT